MVNFLNFFKKNPDSSSIKIHLISGNENWVIDRFVDEFYQHNADISTKSLRKCNIVWIMAPWRWKSVSEYYLLNRKV